MNRSDFFKKTCGLGVCSCIGMGLLSIPVGAKSQGKSTNTAVIPTDARQLQNVLSFIDATMNEPVKKKIFERLGYEHTTDTGFVNWINGYKKDLKSFFDRVNSNKDTYWEKLEYDPESSTIKVTGKIVDKCACPFAQQPNPPKSLCNYCCIGFQKTLFEMLVGKPVKVRLDESFLLGSNRCSNTIFVDGKLPLEKI